MALLGAQPRTLPDYYADYPFPLILRWTSTASPGLVFGYGTLDTDADRERGTAWITSLGHTVVDIVPATPEVLAAIATAHAS